MSSPALEPHFPPLFPASLEAVVLPVDKPAGWTSFDVIRKLRRVLGVRKIGHAGTLDPMATGLLICLIGRATKQMEHFMRQPKRYSGTLRLGTTTDTYDAEGASVAEREWRHITAADLDAARLQFLGEIEQTTPMYSAVKVQGERLYRKARRGETVERPLRQVSVHAFDFHVDPATWEGPDADFTVACSKGTYVRSLAHDLGESLGCGAHLIRLRREAIGDLDVSRSWTLDALEAARHRHEEGM